MATQKWLGIVGVLLLLVSCLLADNINNVKTGNYSATGTWTNSTVPGVDDIVWLGGNFTVTVQAGNNYTNAVTILGNNNYDPKGSGTLTVSGGVFTVVSNVEFSGTAAQAATINISGGELLIRSNIIQNTSLATRTINLSSGTLEFTGANSTISNSTPVDFNFSGGTLKNAVSVEPDINLTGTGTVQSDSGKTTTISGVIVNTGGLTKSGVGTLTLSGNNTFSGGISLTGGVVKASTSGNALGSGTVTFSDSSIRLVVSDGLTVTNSIVLGANAGAAARGLIENSSTGNATLSGRWILITAAPAAGGHFVGNSTGSLTINHTITNTVVGGSVICRRGTVILGGGGNYSDLTIGEGTVRLSANNGIATNAIVGMGATGDAYFDLAGYNQSLVGIRQAGNIATIGNSSTTADSTLTITGTSTNAGIIADVLGSGTKKVALIVTGSGIFTLTGTNTYTGPTTISGGILIGKSGGYSTNSALYVTSGATNSVCVTSSNGWWACKGLTNTQSSILFCFQVSPSATVAPLYVNGDVEVSTATKFGIAATNVVIEPGTYPLIKYTGSCTGTPPSVAYDLPKAVRATIVNNTANKSIDLNVTAGTMGLPNWSYEVKDDFEPLATGEVAWIQYAQESWRQFQRTGNGGVQAVRLPDTNLFAGVAPAGRYIGRVGTRYGSYAASNTIGSDRYEAMVQILPCIFRTNMTYKITVAVGASSADAGYFPLYGYAVLLAVGGTNMAGASYQGSVNGGVVIAQDVNSLTVLTNAFVTASLTYRPNPANDALVGQYMQLRLCSLYNPTDLSRTNNVYFDNVSATMFAQAVENIYATNILARAANLVGMFTTGSTSLYVRVYYGATNSSTNKVWAYTNNIGWYTNVASYAITNLLSGLLPTSQYYYAFHGSNAATEVWDINTNRSFITRPEGYLGSISQLSWSNVNSTTRVARWAYPSQ